jgi:Ti type entry exclusion protein TrbK
MVISKPLSILIIFGVAVAAGGGVWLCVQPGQSRQGATGGAASSSPLNDDARKRAETFFGGKKDYDLTGGQEMKPRW